MATDGTVLYTGSDDESVKIWSIANGTCLQTLTSSTIDVNSVLLLNGFLYTGGSALSAKNVIQQWSLTNFTLTANIAGVPRTNLVMKLLAYKTLLFAIVSSQLLLGIFHFELIIILLIFLFLLV